MPRDAHPTDTGLPAHLAGLNRDAIKGRLEFHLKPFYRFNPACQFTTIVSGPAKEDVSGSANRNRKPSGATS